MTTMRARVAAFVVCALLALSGVARASLITQHLFNEASSGTTPTTVHDTASGTAFNLTAALASGAMWSTTTGGDAINFAGSNTDVATNSSVAGTKIQTALAGANTATFELVVDTASTTDDTIMFLADTVSGGSIFFFALNTTGTMVYVFAGDGAYNCAFTSSRHVWTAVYQSGASAGSRILLYKDGSAVTCSVVVEVTSNVGIDTAVTWANVRYDVGGAFTTDAVNGKVAYEAIYSGILSTISSNATALLANNDADPNTPVTPTLGGWAPWDWGVM